MSSPAVARSLEPYLSDRYPETGPTNIKAAPKGAIIIGEIREIAEASKIE
jgi:hypothetical protein